MRISEAQAQKNRDKVVAKASRLYRERGFDGLSVSDLMNAAGFTHGGFYNHFNSKDELAVEAFDHAFRTMDAKRDRSLTLDQLISDYLSDEVRKTPGASCPAAALATEVARQPEAIKQVFADGLDRMIVSVADRLPNRPDTRSEALDLVCRMLGALVLARAMPASSSLGDELLATATARCKQSAAAFNRHAARRKSKD